MKTNNNATRLCPNCGNYVPVRTIIDGKRYNLQRRKLCFDCSPFKNPKGKLNKAKQTRYSEWTQEEKQQNIKSGMERGWRLRKELLNLHGGCCQKCGYDKCDSALHFHHTDPTTKLFSLNVSDVRAHAWANVLKEADKCIVLCSNCHTESHNYIKRDS